MFSRKKKFFVLSIAFLCVSCLLFTGCARNNNTQQTPPANDNQTESQDNNDVADNGTDNEVTDNNITDNRDENNNDGNDNVDNNDLNARAEKIADAVTKDIAQVSDTRVVISERLAYVSVAIDKTADTAESATLKDEVSKVVKNVDREIETVYVMEDADTFTRMEEIGNDIANGRPISGFAEELENMFVRAVPTPNTN